MPRLPRDHAVCESDFARLAALTLEELNRIAYRGQRIAQLVAEHREEFVFRFVCGFGRTARLPLEREELVALLFGARAFLRFARELLGSRFERVAQPVYLEYARARKIDRLPGGDLRCMIRCDRDRARSPAAHGERE